VLSFQLYIDGNNNALEIGVDQNQVTFGASYAQTAAEDTTQGKFNVSGLNVASQTMSDGFGYYPIDDQRVLAIEVDGQQLGMLMVVRGRI
jgi:hypothetical protein